MLFSGGLHFSVFPFIVERMGFAFLESYWFEKRPKAKRCPRCKGPRGAVMAQFSLNVNQPQPMKEPICPRCDRRWCEKNYPPIYWGEKTRGS